MAAFARGRDFSLLVEKQMRNWEIARSQKQDLEPPETEVVQDFVCLSRQVGVPDWEVAAGLSERLSWPVFGRELLDSMAGDDMLRRRVYDSLDQRELGWVESTLRPFFQASFGRNDYFRKLGETMLSLAVQGHCIFVGRGADLILPRDQGLRVRLVAAADQRVVHLSHVREVDAEQAMTEIEHVERDRSEFLRRHFGVEPDDPTRFDLMLNLGRVSAEQATELILEARRIFGR